MKNKIYFLDNGYFECNKNNLVVDPTMDATQPVPVDLIKIPIYSVLIDNPEEGWILFDTGGHPDAMKGRWSPTLQKSTEYTYTDEQLLINQLDKVGLKPEDVGTVVLSHMHSDHAGGLFLFKDTAEVFVNRDEFKSALLRVFSSQDSNAHGGFCKADVTESVQNYHFLDNEDYKIAPGVELLYTPGHTDGMMSLMVHLEDDIYIFPVDSLNMADNYGPPPRTSRVNADNAKCSASIEKILELEQRFKAKIIYPHDIEQFAALKHAPEYYD